MAYRNGEHNPQREKMTFNTTTSGNHPSGNYDTVGAVDPASVPLSEANVWIDRRDLAKQGMANKGDPRNAKAAPDHPHIGHVRGSGPQQ